ncbi:unnamed protein product, partial [Laminaria digitata]
GGGGGGGGGGARASGSAGGARAEEKGRDGADEGRGRRGSAGSGGSGDGGGEGGGGGRRGSAERGRGGDAKASAKQDIEERGEAAKALGAPQSRRLSSRVGGPRSEAKSDSFAAGGLGDEPSGMGGRDLTGQIEACTGDISVTREMLEPIISRPKLSDKLLNMPPFRFLHDIISEVTRQTNFGQGLYSGDELDSSLVKAKPAKIAYLDKLIMLVGNSLNSLVDARPAKIVAGLESENTNRLLQLLALAAVERPDSSRAVAAVLGSSAAPVKRRSSSGTHRRVSSASSGVPVPTADKGGARGASAGEEKRGGAGARQEPAEDKAGTDAGSEEAADGGGEAPRSMRPRTARRRPPAVKDNTKGFADNHRSQVPEQSAAAPKAANIMMDGDGDQDSDDDEMDGAGGTTRPLPTGGVARGGGGGAKSEGGHTAMVADILKEKERAEFRAKEADAEAKGGGGGQDTKGTPEGGGIRMGRLRGAGRTSGSPSLSEKPRGSTGAGGGGGGYGDGDVAKLKEAIQTLCQSTHPLGKCMDFVHEDMSLMSQEMDRWKALQKVKAKALESERASLESFLQPLNSQLRDLDDQVGKAS